MMISEPELISRARGGDAGAYAELVRRYRDRLYAFCYSRTGSFEDSRDLCQETFIQAYKCLGQLKDALKFGAWLRKIAANMCVRWVDSRREVLVAEVILPDSPPESPRAALVRQALAGLPDNERIAVAMCYMHGLSYAEIAEFLEISGNAIRGRLHRARKTLKTEVLKMMAEEFENNRLDESFVISTVKAALDEAENAQYGLRDKKLALQKVDEVVMLLDHLRESELADPKTAADAFTTLALREVCLGKPENAADHLKRAKSLYDRSGDIAALTRWRATTAYERLNAGDLNAAREIYSTVLEQMDPSSMSYADIRGGLLAIESIGDVPWDKVYNFNAGSGFFGWEDQDVITCQSSYRFGKTRSGYPSHLSEDGGPPRDPAAFPSIIMRLKPEPGDRLIFIDANVHAFRAESIFEPMPDTVNTSAGRFDNCLRAVEHIFKADPDDLHAIRTMIFARGVGLIRITFETVGGLSDTSELTSFAVASNDNCLPLNTGNWWRYRWIEGEEKYGYRTDFYKEITSQSDTGCTALQYVLCIVSHQ